LILRKNYDDLVDWIDRASYMYKDMGAKITGNPAVISWPSGAIFRTGHLNDRDSYEKYLGHEYPRVLIEELTLIPQENYYIKILGSCRSTIKELKPQIFCTTNPGGAGHAWVKRRFVDPAPWGKPFIGSDTGRSRIFIHGTVDDNPTLTEKDPGYIKFLDNLKETNKDLWKAWRLGDWDIFVGQVFMTFARNIHVIPTMDVSLDLCQKIITYDWGYNAPGAAVWLAIAPENRFGVKRVYAYRQLYQNQKTPEQWADDIRTFTEVEKTDFMVLPRDCFASAKGEKSIASIFEEKLNTKIVQGESLTRAARMNRQAVIHQAFSNAVDGKPNMYILEKVIDLIRTIPEMVYDDTDIELINTDSEDHLVDALGMGLRFIKRKYGVFSGPVSTEREQSMGIMTMPDGQFQVPGFLKEIAERNIRSSKNPESMV
jgi:hypothetical protein